MISFIVIRSDAGDFSEEGTADFRFADFAVFEFGGGDVDCESVGCEC